MRTTKTDRSNFNWREADMAIQTGEAAPLSQSGFDSVLNRLGVDQAALWSLLTVETRGFGFLPDRRPKILFERHIFHKRTGGRFSDRHPSISSPSGKGYLGDAAEYDRLAQAIKLDHDAALESASWGLGQVMGFNAKKLGYQSAEAMVDEFCKGENEQLEGACRFISGNNPLKTAFTNKRWDRVAFFYNGRAHAENGYARKLDHYFTLYRIKGCPSVRTRIAQAWLTYLRYSPRGVDGIIGDGTLAAIVAFQQDRGMNVTAELDDATFEALKNAAS